jgi:hypothetical protein
VAHQFHRDARQDTGQRQVGAERVTQRVEVGLAPELVHVGDARRRQVLLEDEHARDVGEHGTIRDRVLEPDGAQHPDQVAVEPDDRVKVVLGGRGADLEKRSGRIEEDVAPD